MNIKKLFATLAGVSLFAQTVVPFGALAATYSQELQDAYDWAYSKGVTTMSPIDNANMYGAITRAQMAKMLSVYATEVLGKTPNTSATCEFTDINSLKNSDLHDYVIESCQLGIMGQGITAFRPYDTISRAEFGTALSRVLWDDKYEGGTPYYAKHLDALKAAGIMTQIDNPENRDEIRGYVMLMLMRSEEGSNNPECQDPLVKVACAMDSDECPAACKEGAKDENKVAKGDLEVTADAAPNKKILATGTSDLDTITFKTSESVDINKITLERYGYSDADQVVEVRLEDQDGNVIADAKGLTKDKVTLSLKKGYRTVDGKLEATLVVTTSGAAGTMGFKVTDVDSTAANLNLDDYNPNIYDVVDYAGKTVYVEIKGTDKDYNYEEGKSYEVARLKVKAGENAILVKGFTLTNDGKLDMGEFLDELTVTAEGKDVKGLKYSVNKDDELVISFDDVNIDINKNATFVISASFKEFDDYGETVAYYIAETADVNAVEKKNGTRVTLDLTAAGKADAKAHKFAGGKIKIVNKKLGNVDAAQGSEDIVVAEGTITVTEAINKLSFDVTVSNTGVESLKFVINDDEYEGKPDNKNAPTKFSFSNVEIEKSGTAQFLVGIFDRDGVAGNVTFSTFNKDAFSGAKYSDANEYVQTTDVAGSISFSKVTIQASKGALENNNTKDVEFLVNETSRKTVFDGTYTAKKGDVYLNSFYIEKGSVSGTPTSNDNITFYVSIDGEEVGDTDRFGSGNNENFSDILVEAGKSVKVKVEAEVETYATGVTYSNYTLVLEGEDKNGNDAGHASDTLVKMKTKESGSVTIPSTSDAKTALLKEQNTLVAEFTVKPSNNGGSDDEIMLDELVLSGSISGAAITADQLRVKVAGVEQDDDSLTYTPNESIPSNGVTVQVYLKDEVSGNVSIRVVSINGKEFTNTYSKYFVDALVTFVKQDEGTSSTEYELDVENPDDYTINNFAVWTKLGSAACTSEKVISTIGDGETFSIYRGDAAKEICKIVYEVDKGSEGTSTVTIDKDTYKDYFKVGGKELAVPKA